MPRFGSLRIGANGRVPVSSGFRVMSFRRRPCERRARLTHHVLQLPNCHVDAVYFLRDLQIFLLHVDRQVSGGVFQTVVWNFTVCKIGSSIIVSSFRDMLVVVESMFEVCVELSPTAPGTVGIRAFGF